MNRMTPRKIGKNVVHESPSRRGYRYERTMRTCLGGDQKIIRTGTGRKIQFDAYMEGMHIFGITITGDTAYEFKNWRQPLPLKEVKKFLHKVRRAEKSTGRIISTMIIRNSGGYSKQALKYAARHGIILE